MKNKKQSRKGDELQWLRSYARHYRRGFLICLLSGLAGVAAGIGGIQMLRVFLEAVCVGSRSSVSLAVIVFVLLLLAISFHFLFRRFLLQTEKQIRNDLWFDLYDHLLDVNWERAAGEKDFGQSRKQENDICCLAEGMLAFPLELILRGIFLGGSLILLSNCDLTLALVTLLCGGICSFFMWHLQKTSVGNPARVREMEGRLDGFYRDSLQYMRWIQTFSMQDYFKVRLTDLQKKWKRTAVEKDQEDLLKAYGWGMGCFFLLVIGLGRSVPLLLRGAIQTGSFFWIFLLLTEIGLLFYSLCETAGKILPLRMAAARFRGWMEMPIEIRLDEEWTELLRVREKDGLSVYAEQVEYSEEGEQMTAMPMSFEAHPGEWIGIDGRPENGRNIFVPLLLGQVFPQAGELRLSHAKGIQCQISAATRPFFAYVSREPVMFPGTIADNLRLGRTDLSEEQLWEALAEVCADHFVEMLPQELNTYLGGKEKLLSDSELQQLALARAILSDAPILLLEDVTFSFPPALERDILNNLYRLWRKKTCIFLSPRLQVLGRCDRVYQFTESGLTPAGELLEDGDGIWEPVPCNLRQLAEVFSPL